MNILFWVFQRLPHHLVCCRQQRSTLLVRDLISSESFFLVVPTLKEITLNFLEFSYTLPWGPDSADHSQEPAKPEALLSEVAMEHALRLCTSTTWINKSFCTSYRPTCQPHLANSGCQDCHHSLLTGAVSSIVNTKRLCVHPRDWRHRHHTYSMWYCVTATQVIAGYLSPIWENVYGYQSMYRGLSERQFLHSSTGESNTSCWVFHKQMVESFQTLAQYWKPIQNLGTKIWHHLKNNILSMVMLKLWANLSPSYVKSWLNVKLFIILCCLAVQEVLCSPAAEGHKPG